MNRLDEHNPTFVALLFILGAVALFLNLGLEPLHFEEPRRAIVALEMELTGNWWVPKINGEYYYNKPPVYNWLLIGLYKVFGYEEWCTSGVEGEAIPFALFVDICWLFIQRP